MLYLYVFIFAHCKTFFVEGIIFMIRIVKQTLAVIAALSIIVISIFAIFPSIVEGGVRSSGGNGEGNENGLILPANSDVLIDEEHFPDVNFRKYILTAIDANKDGILNKDEIDAVIKINIKKKSVATLQG